MISICTSDTTRTRDQLLIEQAGIPGRVLMELAGHRAAAVIHTRAPNETVAVLCGPGNNGGDGFVVARWLGLWGHRVRVWCSKAPVTPDAKATLETLARLGCVPEPLETVINGATVFVDALLGTGQRSAPRGAIAEGVQALRDRRIADHRVFALDLPTGICADTGQRLGTPEDVVQAEETITFGYWKPGLLCAPGSEYAGDVTVVDIGLDYAQLLHQDHSEPDAWLLTAEDVRGWMPTPGPSVAKWDRGHVAIRAGGGAAVLASLGAFAAGAGLVTLLTPRATWPALQGCDPSVILAEPAAFDPKRHDALVIGPGLGLEHGEEVRELWRSAPVPVLADADALTLLARDPCSVESEAFRVITPHTAEAARLLGTSRDAIEADRFGAARALGAFGTPVLKGPHTLIGARVPWVSPFADGRLAVAGSGDVLAGCIATGLARGHTPERAAGLGVWLHGAAAAHLPVHGTARHLVDAIRQSAAALLESAP